MSIFRSRVLSIALIVTAALSGGCVSNRLDEYFAVRPGAALPRVGIGLLLLRYESDTHASEGSIAGMIDAGARGLLGDDSVKVLRQHGNERRAQILARMQETLQSSRLFEYVPLAEDNADAAVPERGSDVAAYARKHRLDVVIVSRIKLERGWHGFIGHDKAYLSQTQKWDIFNGEGQRIGIVYVVKESEDFQLDGGLYDMREPQFAERIVKLTDTATQACLVELQKEIDKVVAKTSAGTNRAVGAERNP